MMMARHRDQGTDLPPLLMIEAQQRKAVLVRERHELRKRLVRSAPRSLRRLHLEDEVARVTHAILAIEVELAGGKRKPS